MPNFNLPINSVSFGVVSTAILRAVQQSTLKDETAIFPIGNVDLSSQKVSPEFGLWLQNHINNCLNYYHRQNPTFKLWHINGSVESVGAEQNLITFHETDQITPHEKILLQNQNLVFVTSRYTKQTMEDAGLANVRYLELGFDKDNFYEVPRKPIPDVITFGLFGKFEFRKAHAKILQAWTKAFGNNYKYRLVAAISNPFLGRNPEEAAKVLNQNLHNIFGGKRYGNINILNSVPTNAEYNDIINNIDIVIGCSRSEGRDLPVFHAVGLGKHCVGLNAHAYKDYLNSNNAVLIEPTGLVPAEDGLFFRRNTPFNQGNFYDFNADDFVSACETAVKRYNSSRENLQGKDLQKLTYNNTLAQLCGQ